MNTTIYIKSMEILKETIENKQEYPFCLPIVCNTRKIDFESPVTFFVGENGTGKSTLLEAIAVSYGFNPEGGSKNFNFSTVEVYSELYKYLKLVRTANRPKNNFFLRAESFYNVASEIDRLGPDLIKWYGGKSLHKQSHGESFMALFLNRFSGNGFYILDEPEAALSPIKQMVLLAEIDQLVKSNSQFIIATHSPILLAYPNAQIYVFNENGIKLTPYKETEHYIITKQFLDCPERMIGHLLD